MTISTSSGWLSSIEVTCYNDFCEIKTVFLRLVNSQATI